jgi:hypothetical protein
MFLNPILFWFILVHFTFFLTSCPNQNTVIYYCQLGLPPPVIELQSKGVLLFDGSTYTGFYFTLVHKYLKGRQTPTLQRKAKMCGRRLKKAHHDICQKQPAAPIRNTQSTKCALPIYTRISHRTLRHVAIKQGIIIRCGSKSAYAII